MAENKDSGQANGETIPYPQRDSKWKNDVLASYSKGQAIQLDPVIKRYIKECGVSMESAVLHITEMRKFLALSAHSKLRYSILGTVDHAWHTFILFTKMYADYCGQTASTFIHHAPAELSLETRSDDNRIRYQQLLKDYVAAFDVEPPTDIWPQLASSGVKSEGDSCISCQCDSCEPYFPPCDDSE